MLRLELYKIFKRPRTYISFGVVTAITCLIQLAMLADGKSFIQFILQSASNDFSIEGNVLNGYLITYIILQSLLIQIPLLVALVAGDLIAGEANMGTLRLLLTKPISRTRLVLVKFAAGLVYTMLLLIWFAIIGLGLSVLLFGSGDLINIKSDSIVFLLENEVLWRYGYAFGFAFLAMSTVTALAIFLSVLAENSVGPIIGTMGVIIVLMIFTNLELPLFNLVKPYLFTTHMIAWKGFFDAPIQYGEIMNSAIILVLYIIGFLLATIIIFNKKDIKS
ncbi:MAG: ABC transporter permease subunit [Flavipsychrobacter sp.]